VAGKYRAVILTADRFEDFELFFPYFRLIEEGFDVEIAAPKAGHLEGEHGYGLEVKRTFSEIDPEDYDLLTIPGGAPNGAPAEVRKEKKAQSIANSFLRADKPVASICHGPWTLVSAGAVKGRKLTSFWGDGVPAEIKGGRWQLRRRRSSCRRQPSHVTLSGRSPGVRIRDVEDVS
jgi:archaeal arginyl aminopeptidase